MPLQQAPQKPAVVFEDRVTSGISLEVFTAYHAVPRRGAEAGGILLGSRSGDRILVEDFEPVLCEHRFGPSYILSEEDFRGLEESLDWFRTPGTSNLQVLGFYRSQTRPDAFIDRRDNELMLRFFPGSGSLFLLLKPTRTQTITRELFVFAEGALHRGSTANAAVVGSNDSAAAPSDPESPARNVLTLPPRPRRTEEPEESEERAGPNWTWVAAVAALTIVGAILGYRSGSPAGKTIAPVSRSASSSATLPVSNPSPGEARNVADVSVDPAVPNQMEREIRDALAQWERAVRSGDPNLIAASYAARLDRYFGQSDLSNAEVRKAAAQSMARYGKPAILRISDLSLIPLSATRAAASFRKHWQTSGPRVFAGEEQERLVLVKGPDGWKIASEEETKVYWKQRPRG